MKDSEKKDSKEENLLKERDEYLNGWKRAKADLINYKKQVEERMEYVVKSSNEDLIKGILPVLDSFERALMVEENEGLTKIKEQMEQILDSYGVKSIETVGEKYDPRKHESVSMVDSEEESETIVEEIEKGYTLYEKVLRPAKVIIVK